MDIAALSSIIAAPAQASPPPLSVGDAFATERFNAIMNGPDLAGVSGIQALTQSSMTVAPLDVAPTLGGQILAGLRDAGTGMSSKWQSVVGGLDSMSVQPSVSEMLRVQSDLLQLSFQYELVGKAVAKSTENVNTLVRMS